MIKLPAINTAPSPHKGTALILQPLKVNTGGWDTPSGRVTSGPFMISLAHLGQLMAQKRRRSCYDS